MPLGSPSKATAPQLSVRPERLFALHAWIVCAHRRVNKPTFCISAPVFLRPIPVRGAYLRVSELATLRLADVDVVAGRIRVNQGKGGKDRILYVPARLRPILAHYVSDVRPRLVGRLVHGAVPADAGWLFVNAHPTSGHRLNPRGQSLISRSWYQVILRRARTLLGVKLSPHKLRHTCATYLLYHGAQLETIQRVLGHADVQTTMIYLHTPQKRQEEEIGRIFG